VEKFGRVGQTTDDNIIQRMRFTCWITKATNTLRICNTYSFSTATMITRTSLNVTLYIHCLSSCSFISVGKTGVYESSTVRELLVFRLINIMVFWDVTSCSLVDMYRRIGGLYNFCTETHNLSANYMHLQYMINSHLTPTCFGTTMPSSGSTCLV
jgi:hypothetical protein